MGSQGRDRRIYAEEVKAENDGLDGYLLGWVHEIRDLGAIIFLLLRDMTGICQVSLRPSEIGGKPDLSQESVVRVRGVVRAEPKARMQAEVKAESITLLSKAVEPLPYDVVGKVSASMDTRLEHRVLDLRRPLNRAIFSIGDTVLAACREYLRQNRFTEVRTPRIIATASEGGAALFKVDYFGKTAFLAQSPQLYKEELTTVFERVFEIGPFFRAEESHTRRHVSEFTSIDIEAAFMELYDVMDVLEGLVVHVIKRLISERSRELELLGAKLRVPRRPFKRMTYDEAVEELREMGIEKAWGEDFTTPELRKLGSRHAGYYFITHFPTATKPFYYQPNEKRPEVTDTFDLMYQWLELASGGTRISDRSLLERRLRECGLNPEAFEHHLKVYDYGMPVHAGWGLGFERLLMVMTRRTNIREVLLYPRDRFRLTP